MKMLLSGRRITNYVFLILVPLAAHFLYSRLGYNPTDDGFILAYSRRILEGAIPHRDFISIRPAGSAYLHVPFVLAGGDYVFLLSRYFVWFQFAVIALAWTRIIDRSLGLARSAGGNFFYALIAFVFSAHHFPLMAWHTVDGLFLIAAGIYLCMKNHERARIAGYFLIGLSFLCKQSFLPILLTPFVLGDWRRGRCLAAMLLPGILYACLLIVTGAVPDALLQLTSQTDIVRAGVRSYVSWSAAAGFAAGCLALLPASERLGRWFPPAAGSLPRLTGLGLVHAVPLWAALNLENIFSPFFALFGASAGALLSRTAGEASPHPGAVRTGALLLLTAWCASLSLGYNTPVLMAGPLAVFLFSCGRLLIPENRLRRPAFLLPLLSGFVVLLSFGRVRSGHIYRERPAPELNCPLDDVFPGGKGIWTNENTCRFLADLKEAAAMARGRTYAVIPDLAGYWVKAPQNNPLSIDWAMGIELNRPSLVDRVIGDLEAEGGPGVVIVQKVSADSLAGGPVPLPDNSMYAVVQHVRSRFRKTGETEYFELYERPGRSDG